MKVTYLFLLFAVIGAGCENTSKKVSVEEQNKLLLTENEQLTKNIEKLHAQKEQFENQLKIVNQLGREVRLDAMPVLDKIKLTSRSGLYDKDKNGSRETLMVYVRAIDDDGDSVKIPGSIAIQLWNLNAEAEKALLRSWKLAPEEIKKLWSGTFMTGYYRLRFDVSGLAVSDDDTLTINAVFTDYLSGRTAKAQRIFSH
ncbi:MAG: hypothetical protein GWO86_00515 [Planctomycetes bacterium]|nr:hypothetical protein [Planctomycetota bacterium]